MLWVTFSSSQCNPPVAEPRARMQWPARLASSQQPTTRSSRESETLKSCLPDFMIIQHSRGHGVGREVACGERQEPLQ
jgi:hypothetical protein